MKVRQEFEYRARRKRWMRQYYLIAGIAYATICVLTFTLIFAYHTTNLRSTEKRLKATGYLLRETMERVFLSSSWLAETAGDAYLRHLGSGNADNSDLTGNLRRLLRREAFAHQVSVVDQNGIFIASSISPISGADLSDREHIRVHMSAGGPPIFVSAPLRGRISGALSLNVTRRFYSSDGEWAGIVVVSYDPARISEILRQSGWKDMDYALLLNADGLILSYSGDNIPLGSTAPYVSTAADAEGVKWLTSSLDGSKMLFVFSRIANAPLTVAVSRSYAGILSEAYPIAVMAMIGLLAFGFASLAGRSLLLRLLRTQLRAENALVMSDRFRGAGELIDGAFRATGVLACLLNHNGKLIIANQPVRSLLTDAGSGQEKDQTVIFGHLMRDGKIVSEKGTIRIETVTGQSRTVFWVLAAAPWIAEGYILAMGFDRTEQEQQEQLLHQRARLTQLGEMAAGLSHEMAQPLSVIGFAASIIRSSKSGREDDEIVNVLERGVNRLTSTVTKMKMFSRRRFETTIDAFDVVNSIEAALSLISNDLILRSVRIDLHFPTGVIYAYGDGLQFEQVILNLLLNSRDALESVATEVGSENLIEISVDAEDDKTVRIIVSDNGPGIPSSIADRIFEPFVTTKASGTGLGLALSYSMIQQMGGRLSLLRGLKGCHFEVALPRTCSLKQSTDERGGTVQEPHHA